MLWTVLQNLQASTRSYRDKVISRQLLLLVVWTDNAKKAPFNFLERVVLYVYVLLMKRELVLISSVSACCCRTDTMVLFCNKWIIRG